MTAMGRRALMRVPSPSCPDSLAPQQAIELSGITAQVWASPAEISAAETIPDVKAGKEKVRAVLPFPSCPKRLSPQH
jgi:hypothetical protein